MDEERRVCRLCPNKNNLLDVGDEQTPFASEYRNIVRIMTGITIYKNDVQLSFICRPCLKRAIENYDYRRMARLRNKELQQKCVRGENSNVCPTVPEITSCTVKKEDDEDEVQFVCISMDMTASETDTPPLKKSQSVSSILSAATEILVNKSLPVPPNTTDIRETGSVKVALDVNKQKKIEVNVERPENLAQRNATNSGLNKRALSPSATHQEQPSKIKKITCSKGSTNGKHVEIHQDRKGPDKKREAAYAANDRIAICKLKEIESSSTSSNSSDATYSTRVKELIMASAEKANIENSGGELIGEKKSSILKRNNRGRFQSKRTKTNHGKTCDNVGNKHTFQNIKNFDKFKLPHSINVSKFTSAYVKLTHSAVKKHIVKLNRRVRRRNQKGNQPPRKQLQPTLKRLDIPNIIPTTSKELKALVTSSLELQRTAPPSPEENITVRENMINTKELTPSRNIISSQIGLPDGHDATSRQIEIPFNSGCGDDQPENKRHYLDCSLMTVSLEEVIFTCEYCHRVFKNKGAYAYHRKRLHQKCPLCKKLFNSVEEMHEHSRNTCPMLILPSRVKVTRMETDKSIRELLPVDFLTKSLETKSEMCIKKSGMTARKSSKSWTRTTGQPTNKTSSTTQTNNLQMSTEMTKTKNQINDIEVKSERSFSDRDVFTENNLEICSTEESLQITKVISLSESCNARDASSLGMPEACMNHRSAINNETESENSNSKNSSDVDNLSDICLLAKATTPIQEIENAADLSDVESLHIEEVEVKAETEHQRAEEVEMALEATTDNIEQMAIAEVSYVQKLVQRASPMKRSVGEMVQPKNFVSVNVVDKSITITNLGSILSSNEIVPVQFKYQPTRRVETHITDYAPIIEEGRFYDFSKKVAISMENYKQWYNKRKSGFCSMMGLSAQLTLPRLQIASSTADAVKGCSSKRTNRKKKSVPVKQINHSLSTRQSITSLSGQHVELTPRLVADLSDHVMDACSLLSTANNKNESNDKNNDYPLVIVEDSQTQTGCNFLTQARSLGMFGGQPPMIKILTPQAINNRTGSNEHQTPSGDKALNKQLDEHGHTSDNSRGKTSNCVVSDLPPKENLSTPFIFDSLQGFVPTMKPIKNKQSPAVGHQVATRNVEPPVPPKKMKSSTQAILPSIVPESLEALDRRQMEIENTRSKKEKPIAIVIPGKSGMSVAVVDISTTVCGTDSKRVDNPETFRTHATPPVRNFHVLPKFIVRPSTKNNFTKFGSINMKQINK